MVDKLIDVNNPYTQMQQSRYNYLADFDAAHSGWRSNEPKSFAVTLLEAHNEYEDYKTYLWKDIPDLKQKDVLDFGCGPGRNLLKYHDTFNSIDGVDLATKNLETARQWLTSSGLTADKFKLYKNDGITLMGIPSQSYDVVMSTICLQHISVYDIRFNLLKEFHRVLRPNGYVTLQFLYTAKKPNTVKYYDNKYDADDSNGAYDCVVENPDYIKSDLEKLGFTNFNYYIRPSIEVLGGVRNDFSDWEWIFINAQKI
jgi:SAM-dependent methyltransferase